MVEPPLLKNTGRISDVEMKITPTIRTKAVKKEPLRMTLRDTVDHIRSLGIGRRIAPINKRTEASNMPRFPAVTASLGVSIQPSDGVIVHWATIRRIPLTIGAVPRRRMVNEPDIRYAFAEITASNMLTQKTNTNCSMRARSGVSKTGPLKPVSAKATAKMAMTTTGINPAIRSRFCHSSLNNRNPPESLKY